MADQRTIEGTELGDRIDQYLRESGLGGRGARVVPLTGDASDRRYFRILPPDGPSVVLALHAGPIQFAALPFANVADLLQQMPLPVPAVLGHSDALGILALQDLGDVTLQAHLGAATPAEHAALYRRAVAFIDLLQRRGAALHPNAAAASGAPPERDRRERDKGRRYQPGLVTRQARRDQHPSRRGRFTFAALLDPVMNQTDCHERESEQHRLGHWRRLEVENVGIESEQRDRKKRSQPRIGDLKDEPRDGVAGEAKGQDRQRDSRCAGAVHGIDLNRQHVQQVRQWKPHRADLRVLRGEAVENAPRDDQMRFRIVMAERQPLAMVKPGGGNANRDGEAAYDLWQPILQTP
jgi:hypothetical protein